MYTEVTSSGDLRNNPLAMSLHPVRIGPNYVIRSDDRNTCSFFPDSLKVKYSNNVASTETTYRTLKSYQPIPTQKTRTYKKQTYEKSYENAKNSSFDDLKCGGFCSIYSCPFCHAKNGNSNFKERNYTMRSYKYSKNNGINKSFCCTKSNKGICNIESCDYCHNKNCSDEGGFCSIESCSYCHRNRVRTPDITMRNRLSQNSKNISITERNKYLNRNNIVRTPDTNCYYRRRKIIRTSTDGNNNINYISPQEESYCLRRKVVHTPDRSYYRSKNIIDTTEENVYENRNRNVVRTPDIPKCNYLYEYSRTPNRMRSNYRYFSRIEKNRNRTPDRMNNYTYNYYNRVENNQEYPERLSARTTIHTDRNYVRNEEIYPRTPNYMPSQERIEIYKKYVNGSSPNQYEDNNEYRSSYNKVVVNKNTYENYTNPQPKKILKKKVIKEDKNIQCSLGPKVLNPINYKMNTKIETIRRGINTNANNSSKLKEVNSNKVTKMSKLSKVSKVSSNTTNMNKISNEMKKLTGQDKKLTKLKTTKTSKVKVNNTKKDPGLLTYKVKIIRIKKKIKTSENNYLLKDGEEIENLEDDKKNVGPKNLLVSNSKQKNFEDEIDEDFEDDENLNLNNNDEDFGEDEEDVPTPKMKRTSYSKREYKEFNDEHNYKDYESNDEDDNENNEYEEKKVEKDPMGNTVVTKSKYVVKRKGVADDFEEDKDSDNY